MSDKKLKIRIHIQQPKTTEATETIEADAQEEPDVLADLPYPPHWNALEKPPFDRRKITTAVVIVSVVLVFAVTVGYMLIGDNETPDSSRFDDDRFETAPAADYSAGFNTFDDRSAWVPLSEQQEQQPESPEKEQRQETAKQADDPDVADRVEPPDTKAITDTDAPVPRLKPESPVGAQMPILLKPAMKPATKPADSGGAAQPESESKSVPPQIASNATGIPVDTKKSAADHAGVIRAQLTRQIRQREPVDDVDRVLLGRIGSSHIYFFIELLGFANQQLSVDWYFEDRRVTETKLHIGARHWRTNARKLLSKGDAGAWRVILRDQAGQVLAERRFVVEI